MNPHHSWQRMLKIRKKADFCHIVGIWQFPRNEGWFWFIIMWYNSFKRKIWRQRFITLNTKEMRTYFTRVAQRTNWSEFCRPGSSEKRKWIFGTPRGKITQECWISKSVTIHHTIVSAAILELNALSWHTFVQSWAYKLVWTISLKNGRASLRDQDSYSRLD